ncbi:hypothetical protein D3C71_1952770 [compost metagenome]
MGKTGLQLRLVSLLHRRTTLPGDQCARSNLRRLHSVVGIGRARWRVNGFNHRGEDFHTAVECM